MIFRIVVRSNSVVHVLLKCTITVTSHDTSLAIMASNGNFNSCKQMEMG